MVTKLSTALVLSVQFLAQANSSASFQENKRRGLVHEDEGFNSDELVHSDEYGEWVHEPEMQHMIRGRRDLKVLYTT